MTDINTRALVNENLTKLNPLLLPLPWLLVGALVIVFIAWKYSGDVEELIDPTQTQKEFPQIFMTDVEMREFAIDGTLRFQLNTPLIRHFQVDEKASAADYTLFDAPKMVFAGDAEKPAWHISAQLGRNHSNGDLFTLSGDVLAEQASKTQGTISVNTAELQLNTREQFAETDKAVTMRSAKTHLETQGLRANFKQDQIELLSNVTGNYEP